jgi:hypothetical protein
VADFRFQSGRDCDVYIPAMLALWGAAIALLLIPLLLSVNGFFMLVRKRQATIGNNPATLHGVIALDSVLYLVLAALHVASPETNAVGLDLATTVVFAFAASGSVLIGSLLVNIFVRLTMQQTPRSNASGNWAARIGTSAWVVWTLTCFVSFLPPIGVLVPSAQHELLIVYFFASGMLISFFAYAIPLSLDPLIRALDQIPKGNRPKRFPKTTLDSTTATPARSEQVQKLTPRLKVLKCACFMMAAGNSVGLIAFAFWPYLRHHAAMWFLAITTPLLALLFVLIHSAMCTGQPSSTLQTLLASIRLLKCGKQRPKDHQEKASTMRSKAKDAETMATQQALNVSFFSAAEM